MRVTKLVREYIEDEVKKIYPTEELPEMVAVRELCNNFQHDIDEEIQKLVALRLTEFKAAHPEVNSVKCENVAHRYNAVTWSTYGTPLGEKNNVHISEQRKKREDATKNILLTLELGGNKADLDRMLAELR